MCGITGVLSADPADHEYIGPMTERLRHRGPDHQGEYQQGICSLGHRRLSIIDLSEAGNQPMSNEDGTIRLVCNGEIYNYQEIRNELTARGHTFGSGSDNEVLLHLYEEYGDGLFTKINGMFAFAIWDQRRRRLLAAVDRFGKKPLYYAVHDGRLALASELKSLLLLPWVSREININAVDRYLTFRYIPAPDTIFKSVQKLEQATLLDWNNGRISLRRYWAPEFREEKPYNQATVEEFTELLKDAVRIRLNSDVPLGMYLSSGVDSSTIAALMRELGQDKRISYSVSFDYKYNEIDETAKIARFLDFGFNPIRIEAADFDRLPDIAYSLDEPFGDLIVIPSYRLARKAKEQLTVVLTGDGADEILNGYLHQKMMTRWNRWAPFLKRFPVPAMVAGAAGLAPLSLLNAYFDYPDRLGPREKMKLVRALSQSGQFGTFYEGVTSCFTAADKRGLYTKSFEKSISGEPIADVYQEALHARDEFSLLSRLSLMDLKFWIPFIVLFRLDKLNMAHAVETRSPFLDYRLVEMALNLSDEGKLNKTRNKEILRRINARLFEEGLRARGKQAFYMPFLEAYREKFRQWLGFVVNREIIERRGFFEWEYVETMFADSAKGSMLANRQLVALGMLEQWFQTFQE